MRVINTAQNDRGPSTAIAALLIALCAALLYGHTLDHGLLIDDGAMLYFAKVVGLADAHKMITPLAWVYWRPLPRLLLILDVQVWGLDPWGPRLTNLLLLWLMGLATWRLARAAGLGRGTALAAGLLAVANPFAAAATTWIMARYDLLAAIFSLLALAAAARYVRGSPPRPRRALAGVCLWTLAALLSKELAFVLPGLVLLVSLALRPAGVRRLSVATLLPAAISLAVLALVAVLRLVLFGRFGGALNDPGVSAVALGLKSFLFDLPHVFLGPLNFSMFAPEPLVWMVRLFFLAWCALAVIAWLNRGRGRIGLCPAALAVLPSAMYAVFGYEGQCFYRFALAAALLGVWAAGHGVDGPRARWLGRVALVLLAGLWTVAGQAQVRAQQLAAEQMQDVRQSVLRRCADPADLDELVACNLPDMLHGFPLALNDLRGFFLPLWQERTPQIWVAANAASTTADRPNDFRKALGRGRSLVLSWEEHPGRLEDVTAELLACAAAIYWQSPVLLDLRDPELCSRLRPIDARIEREGDDLRLEPKFGRHPALHLEDPGLDSTCVGAVRLVLSSNWARPCSAQFRWGREHGRRLEQGEIGVIIPPGGPHAVRVELDRDPRWLLAGRPDWIELRMLSGGALTVHSIELLPYSD
ncbi:MAG: hypothetical protein P9M14_02305 [Candidatus Alcyoniella australis]|nr:hypothetical protein [Candidatus Alcyoniella australis]